MNPHSPGVAARIGRVALVLLAGLDLACTKGRDLGTVPPEDAVAPASDVQRQTWLKRAKRRESQGWIIVHVEGDARQRGFQHGYLLAREIAEVVRVRRAEWHHWTSMSWEWLLGKTKESFTPRVDAENLSEMDGIVEGMAAVGVPSSRDEIVALNAWFELIWSWWPAEKKKVKEGTAKAHGQSCSAFIATGSMTTDGSVVMGHSNWNGYNEADPFVAMDIVPDKGHRILMQTYPGWVHSGTDFFVTDAGLIGTETTIGDYDGYDEKGVPEFVRMRRATQDASSIDAWCEIMKKGNNGGYANAWLLGDVRNNEIARLELALKNVAFEKKRDGFFVGSNIAEDLRILRLETETNDDDIRDSNVARRVRWHKLMKDNQGKIDHEVAKRLLADHFDSYLQKELPSARTLCSHGELDPLGFSPKYSMPFNPWGAQDAKVVDSSMAKRMTIEARWGSPCGMPFDADRFLDDHPQYEWMRGLLKSRPSRDWIGITALAGP